ncbi:hypothetical protein [Limisalsivibrio acetivorans]|uniref:hypothetical protein n=1 Tax=Limisalsivibrio acetivorans TaxID=1304888 RepID=UPI0003B3C3E4|nr:hypothetical protein [Limisalsivibrio acetivorans]
MDNEKKNEENVQKEEQKPEEAVIDEDEIRADEEGMHMPEDNIADKDKEDSAEETSEEDKKEDGDSAASKAAAAGEKVGDWFMDSLGKGKEEIFRFAKVTRVKLEVVSLRKKKEERVKLLGNRVLELIKDGKLDADLVEPEFTMITSIDKEIEDKNSEIEELKATLGDIPAPGEELNKQKALSADSIPLEKNEEEEEENKPEKP